MKSLPMSTLVHSASPATVVAGSASDHEPPASAGGSPQPFWNGRVVVFSTRSLHMASPDGVRGGSVIFHTSVCGYDR